MKIFYKKDFQRVLEEYKELKKDYDDLLYKYNDKNFTLLVDKNKTDKKNVKLTKSLNNEKNKNKNLLLENNRLNLKISKLYGQKGNLTRKINDLIKENDQLKQKLADSMTDKYLVRKIPSGKIPNTNKMKSVRNVNASVNKLLKEKNE